MIPGSHPLHRHGHACFPLELAIRQVEPLWQRLGVRDGQGIHGGTLWIDRLFASGVDPDPGHGASLPVFGGARYAGDRHGQAKAMPALRGLHRIHIIDSLLFFLIHRLPPARPEGLLKSLRAIAKPRMFSNVVPASISIPPQRRRGTVR